MTWKRLTIAAALAAAALTACDSREDMELRTFALQRMNVDEAVSLVTPYVRQGGTVSGHGQLITVREEPARLDEIAGILARYDGPPAGLRVEVYVLEAGDFDGSSGLPAEATLRELLPYRGYRLLDEASFTTLEWSNFSRQGSTPFAIAGEVRSVDDSGPEPAAAIQVMVEGQTEARRGERIMSTVQAPFGETVVVASHRTAGSGPTLIVALRVQPTTAAARPAASDSVAGGRAGP
jgi:hypothetical protein